MTEQLLTWPGCLNTRIGKSTPVVPHKRNAMPPQDLVYADVIAQRH
jgi:hypothetical protein